MLLCFYTFSIIRSWSAEAAEPVLRSYPGGRRRNCPRAVHPVHEDVGFNLSRSRRSDSPCSSSPGIPEDDEIIWLDSEPVDIPEPVDVPEADPCSEDDEIIWLDTPIPMLATVGGMVMEQEEEEEEEQALAVDPESEPVTDPSGVEQVGGGTGQEVNIGDYYDWELMEEKVFGGDLAIQKRFKVVFREENNQLLPENHMVYEMALLDLASRVRPSQEYRLGIELSGKTSARSFYAHVRSIEHYTKRFLSREISDMLQSGHELQPLGREVTYSFVKPKATDKCPNLWSNEEEMKAYSLETQANVAVTNVSLFCLPVALGQGVSALKAADAGDKAEAKRQLNAFNRMDDNNMSMSREQWETIEVLLEESGVDKDRDYDLEDVQKFQDYLTGYQIVVFNYDHDPQPIYKGPPVDRDHGHKDLRRVEDGCWCCHDCLPKAVSAGGHDGHRRLRNRNPKQLQRHCRPLPRLPGDTYREDTDPVGQQHRRIPDPEYALLCRRLRPRGEEGHRDLWVLLAWVRVQLCPEPVHPGQQACRRHQQTWRDRGKLRPKASQWRLYESARYWRRPAPTQKPAERLDWNLAAGPVVCREALFGGRTEGTRLLGEADRDYELLYYDFTSLYTKVMKYCEYPKGEGERRLGSAFVCPLRTPAELKSQCRGYLSCKILPPRRLFTPVLSYRSKKLLFPLCRTCADSDPAPVPCPHTTEEERVLFGTWTTVELALTLEKIEHERPVILLIRRHCVPNQQMKS